MHGGNEYHLAKAAVMRSGKAPDVVRDAPELQEGLDLFWDAFGSLSTCRQLGQGFVGPIPWTAIMQYCEIAEISDEDQRERMVSYLRTMDRVFQDHINSTMKAKINK